jgi:predicted solute-binding protein
VKFNTAFLQPLLDPKVRQTLAARNDVTQDILEKLAQDPEYDVRLAVAKNSFTSVEILKILCNDKTLGVKNTAEKTIINLTSQRH